MNRKSRLTAIFTIFLALCLFGCNTPKVGEDEILLQIQLDVKEDIGLFVVDYDSNGSGGSGGMSNANKTLLKHDELIMYTLDKAYFDNPSELMHLTLQFTIITDYFDPNYDNIYPEEYTKRLSPIAFDVNFGETYYITITGDRTSGYTAVSDNTPLEHES